MASITCNRGAEHEIELLKQQLALKDAVLASKDALMCSKDALLCTKDELLVELRESKAAVIKDRDALIADLQSSKTAVIQRGNEGSVDTHEPDQKRARVMERFEQPLEKDEVLDEIFSYVGRKEWLYAGGVCRRWRGRYLSMCYKARTSNDEHAFQTSHRSSFVTAARFSMALDNGLKMPRASEAGKFFEDLPLYSQQPIQVLTLARVHGAAWHERLCLDAAYYGNFELLKWLRASGCPWNFVHVAMGVIASGRSDSADMLRWLLQAGVQLNQHDKNKLLFVAGVRGCVNSAEVLLQQGAKWPKSFVGQLEECINSPDKLLTCWHYRAVAWARSKDCPWGQWRCRDLAAKLYNGNGRQYLAKKLFKWAHKNDCPCTCAPTAL
jgi:hypothetical protein